MKDNEFEKLHFKRNSKWIADDLPNLGKQYLRKE